MSNAVRRNASVSAIVITSYSIHYTKLYDSRQVRACLHRWITTENTGNLDNFIGKMGGVCSEYNLASNSLPQTGTSVTKNIFTSTHYRSGAFGIDIPTSNAYPIGVELEVNNADGYVKDIRLVYATKTGSGTAITSSSPSYTAWATGYGGSNELP